MNCCITDDKEKRILYLKFWIQWWIFRHRNPIDWRQKKKIRTYIKTERWHSKNENKLHELSVYGKYFCISWQFEHSWHLQWSKWASLLRLIIAAFKQQFYYLKKCYMFTYLLLLFGIFRGTSGLSISL